MPYKPRQVRIYRKINCYKVSNGVTTREDLKKECYFAGVTAREGSFVFDQWGGLLSPLCDRGFLCYKAQEKKNFCPQFVSLEKESIYLSQKNLRGIFHLAGIIMPSILLDGVAAGRWRKKNIKMTFELFKNISARKKEYIKSTVELRLIQ